ncbi:MAG: ATP-binding protein [Gemmatimonadales bacterium]|jgi:uncharacterized protein|nr:ATP-binding protein [Gemmatimonadales bacterium]
MLVEFRVQNHRSLLDEQVLTMEAGRVGSPDDQRPRNVDGFCLLPTVALYGANASGKSNVLSALGFMRDAVIESHSAWPPQGGVPRDAFAWGTGPSSPSLFEASFLIKGVRHQYGFVVDQTRVVEEWLFAWPKGRRQIWLEREGDGFSFGDNLKGENRAVEHVTRPNALFLSTAAQHDHEQLLPVYAWFRQLRTIRVEGYKERYADAMPGAAAAAMLAALAAASAASPNGMVRLFDLIPRPGDEGRAISELARLDDVGASRVRDLLHAADVGVTDFRVEASPGGGKPRGLSATQVSLRHAAGTGEDGWITLERESAGTRAILRLAPAVIDTLRTGGLLVVDELESSLHPLLASEMLKQFNDVRTNSNHAQLLFTTHDTNLLGTTSGPTALRRDQVWLTEKADNGATHLFPLTDYKPRKAENLERGYLQGRYGAIPFLGALARGEE